MDNTFRIHTIDDFMKDHPELDPSLKPLIEPLITETDDQVFGFIMNFLLV